jgi:hypothetical protein
MLVEFGNPTPKNVSHSDPVVTYVNVQGDHQTFDPNVNVAEFKAHVADANENSEGVTHRPDDVALLTITNLWPAHSSKKPSWVDSDNPDFARVLGEFYGIPVGAPADVEATHWTKNGGPGVNLSAGPTALLVNTGNDIVSRTIGGFIVGFNNATATGATTTSLTATATPFGASAYIGSIVVSTTSGVYGIVLSNTTSVLTIDRWYNPATPGGVAASTPGATDKYMILSGGPPAWFIGISSTNAASVATDTTMAGEITTSGGGLIRAIATYAHSASATTYTLTNTFTANGTDSLPVTVYRDGVFTSMVSGSTTTMMLETLLNASATFSLSGDNMALTHTITV